MSLQRYKTDYKKLIVSGCSFTINEAEDSHVSWPNCLAVWSDLEITNLAVCGAGNKHIANSIILYLEKHKPNLSDTLVLVMWSGIDRVDWITDSSMLMDDRDWRYRYSYDKFTELAISTKGFKNPQLNKAFEQYKVYQNDASLAVNSWLEITALTSYLKYRGYKFYYIAYLDILTNFEKTLSQIDLSLDLTNWIITQPAEFLGEFAKKNKLLTDDGWHPSPEGHEEWVTLILAKKLIDQGIIKEL